MTPGRGSPWSPGRSKTWRGRQEATERIRGVVDTVRGEVAEASSAIARVQQVLQDVLDAQSTIAAAVEEQTVSTAEAQTAIRGASSHAEQMVRDLTLVAETA